ncbi:unnamed protein product [Arctia plantaginis]|uniref:J domain-containing protein n=1 Tax=Arctia plantaginis TaxID=874455 RepID=A0A8S0YMG6_ARCPL|nr:unnamed protein product [Arctia plantaginis]
MNWLMISLGKKNVVSGVRSVFPSIRFYANHYEVLGVTPKSTQSEIKTAYYKLSKVHHPDKSTDETSAKKFRAISEAYEVLGNVKLKKMYDRGLLGPRLSPSRMTSEPEQEPTDPSLKFYKSRDRRGMVPTMDGKTPIYNFDAWAKNHYSNLYEKSKYEKEFLKKKQEKQADATVAHTQETAMFVAILLGGLFVMFAINGTSDYDKDQVSNKKAEDVKT